MRVFRLHRRVRQRRHLMGVVFSADALTAMTLLAIALATLFTIKMTFDRDLSLSRAVQQQMAVRQATNRYIANNFSTVLGLVPAAGSTSSAITVNVLQTQGYLPAGFSTTNGYGQAYNILVRRPTATNQLEVFTYTSGGRSMVGDAPIRAAKLGGSDFGWFPLYDNNGVLLPAPNDVTRIQGVDGGWFITLASLGLASSSANSGRLVTASFFDQGSLVSDFLSRINIGQDEANRMRTDLLIANNFDVYLEGQQKWLSQSINTPRFIDPATAATVPVPSCPPASTNRTGVPGIAVIPLSPAANLTGETLSTFQPWADVVGGTAWKPQIRVRSATGWYTSATPGPGEFALAPGLVTVLVLTYCG